MRYGLPIGLLCALLTGCLGNPNGHDSAHPLTPQILSRSHHFTTPPAFTMAANQWWTVFHDPQLNQLIMVALHGSPTVNIARARLEAAHQAAQMTASSLWPNVTASGYLQRQRFSQFGLVPPPFNGKTFNIGEVGLNFNYELDFWGKNRNLVAAKLDEACAAQADEAEAKLVLSAAVAAAYFQLQSDLARITIMQNTYERRHQLLSIITHRAKQGIESAIPVNTEVAQVQQAQVDLEQARADAQLSKYQLAVLMGLNPINTTFDIPPMSLQASSPHLPPCLPAHLLAARPDLYAARKRAEAAMHQIKVAKTAFYPDINLAGLFSYQSVLMGKLFEPGSQNNLVEGAFDLPIFDAGARWANLGIQYADYDAAVNNYNDTFLHALREALDAQAQLRSYKQQLAAQSKALNAIRHTYHLTTKRYRSGIADYVEVLQQEQLLFQQENLQLHLQTQTLQSTVGLIKALGGHVS